MDNNITASARYKEVIAEIRDLGFEPGAKLKRPGCRPVQRRVDFNQGVDARILAKSPMYLREMATICISPSAHRVRPHRHAQDLRRRHPHGGGQRDHVAVELHALQLHGHTERPVRADEAQYHTERRAENPDLVIPHAVPTREAEGPVSRREELEPVLPAIVPNHAPGDARVGEREPGILHASLRRGQERVSAATHPATRLYIPPRALRARRRATDPGGVQRDCDSDCRQARSKS